MERSYYSLLLLIWCAGVFAHPKTGIEFQKVESYDLDQASHHDYAHGPSPYEFGYKIKDDKGNHQYRKEESDEHNNKKGSYGYTDAYGIYRHVDYIADHEGFRAKIRTNEPGTAPYSPAHVYLNAEHSPQHIQTSLAYKAEVQEYHQKNDDLHHYPKKEHNVYKKSDESHYHQQDNLLHQYQPSHYQEKPFEYSVQEKKHIYDVPHHYQQDKVLHQSKHNHYQEKPHQYLVQEKDHVMTPHPKQQDKRMNQYKLSHYYEKPHQYLVQEKEHSYGTANHYQQDKSHYQPHLLKSYGHQQHLALEPNTKRRVIHVPIYFRKEDPIKEGRYY